MKVCGRMSRGQPQRRTRSVTAALRRCNNKSNNSTIIVDVDISKIDVIIVDTPESSNRRSRGSNGANKRHFPAVICIEEDDDDIGFKRVDQFATSSKTFHPSSSNAYTFEEFDSDECQILNRKGKGHTEFPEWMFDTLSSEFGTSIRGTSEGDVSEGDILGTDDSESDSSDCEIMDGSSVNIREEWEKAALKKKISKRHANSNEGVSASRFHNESGVSPHETTENVNMNSSSCDTYTVRAENEVHSNTNTSANRTDDQLSASDILNGFAEQHSFKLKRKDSARVSDHTVGEGSHEKCDSKIINEPLSEKTTLHGCHSQPEVSYDHNCDQDKPLQSPFSHDTWMQQGLHFKIDGAGSMDNKDNERSSLFTTKLQDGPQCEDMGRYENLSPCNIPSQSMPGPQTGKATVVLQGSSNFQPQDGCASSKPDNYLNGQHTDMLRTPHSHGGEEVVSQGTKGNLIQGDANTVITQSDVPNMDMVSDIENNIIGERERLKESEEYRRAQEEEWASRQRQLRIQSEEAQRLRKRKKAESLRLLDMEKRQKQRLEEIRESQKRDEETVNLKEQIRAEIIKELEKLEMRYRDMASLLRGLGINVGGGIYPLPHEVNAAYKQALLRFHPDRASRTDIRQQVEAEEKFKLISRLKEKLLSVGY